MATYYVYSGAGGTNAGTSWTNAYTAFASAVTAASTDGDFILVHYTHQDQPVADTIHSLSASIQVISVDKDNSDAPTAMGTSGWLGNSTTSYAISINGTADKKIYVYGITLRTSGTADKNMSIGYVAASDMTMENCYFWHGTTGTSCHIRVGYGNSQSPFLSFRDCTFMFGAATQQIQFTGSAIFDNCTFAPTGTVPTSLLYAQAYAVRAELVGCDLSYLTSKTLVPNNPQTADIVLDRCKLASGLVMLASQTSNPTRFSPRVFVYDCGYADLHGVFSYYDALGECVTDTGTYVTAGAAAQSWKITTTGNGRKNFPFVTPPIDVYHSGTSGITPYLECLRSNGTATAYSDAEVWAEVQVKSNSGYSMSSRSSDRQTLANYVTTTAGSAQADGAGTGSWTIGSSSSPKSFKIDSGSAVTPAEAGSLTMRIYSALGDSTTFFVDPQIRT